MSNKKVDSFKNLRTGKYDWKVPARVLNILRGYTKTEEAFKSFNMLLIDHKVSYFFSPTYLSIGSRKFSANFGLFWMQRSRIHAFVPTNVADQLETILNIGDIYLFHNFTVKDLTAEDKFRLGRKQIQIQLGAETLIKKLEENEFSVEKFWFDFYDLDDLKPLTKQTTYLAGMGKRT